MTQRFQGQKRERGEGKLKALIVTVILAIGVLAAWKLVPPYSAEYQLSDKIEEISRFSMVSHETEDQVREKVFKTIQDLEIPAKKEDIKVVAGSQRVIITVEYTVPVDILFYHVDLHFKPTSETKSLT